MQRVEMRDTPTAGGGCCIADRKYLYERSKRIGDAILSALLLAVLWPVMALIALAIVLDDPGASPIFAQTRVGQNGRVFTLYKFRTMCPGAEAYRILRTKLQFTFPGSQNCRVIAVTGPGTPEGKTGSAVNLADSLAQLGRKVLLVDCDMRSPQVAEKLGLGKVRGLSNYLAGQCKLRELFRECSVHGQSRFHVLAAGDLPPNPAELLSSAAMSGMIRAMGKVFDHIILDLPGTGEGSDAMAVSELAHGYLLVVEHGGCSRAALETSLERMESVKANLIGIIYHQRQEKRR